MNTKGQKATADSIAISIRQRMLEKQSHAAAVFEARFTMNALLREAPDIHEAIEDQRGMFHESLVTGTDAEIIKQGEAMCRGWHAAIVAMEKFGIADDAVHIGEFGGVRVAVGRQQKAPAWFREKYGDSIAWLSPREVAALYAKLELGVALKAAWPDGEIVEIRNKSENENV